MNETDEINDKRQFVFGCLLFFTIFSRGGGGRSILITITLSIFNKAGSDYTCSSIFHNLAILLPSIVGTVKQIKMAEIKKFNV